MILVHCIVACLRAQNRRVERCKAGKNAAAVVVGDNSTARARSSARDCVRRSIHPACPLNDNLDSTPSQLQTIC